MTRISLVLSGLLALYMLAACGQSGPLYLPGDPSEVQVPAQQSNDDDDNDDEDDG